MSTDVQDRSPSDNGKGGASNAGARKPAASARAITARVKGFKYLGKRLVTYLIVAMISLVANFMLPRFMPGDPAEQMIQSIVAKTGNMPSPYALAQIYARYGDPDQNVFVAFWNYLVQTLQGDLGLSIQYYPVPVVELIGRALPWTLYLAIVSTIIGWIIGTWAGAKLGWKPGRKLDSIVTPIAMFFSSIPAFWLGLLLVWFVSYKNGLLPPQGAYNEALPINLLDPTFLTSVAIYSILPMVTLVLVGFANWMFTMRNMMITTVNEDYVQLARAKGLKPSSVLRNYAARNALLPNFTGLAQSIGASLTAVILAESVFIYPGVGSLLFAAQGSRDYPVMQGVMLLIIFVSLVFNFIADSVYVLLDPRTKEK